MQDVLRPFVMAIESKSSKLICLSLVSVQKLVAADAIGLDGLLVVIQDIELVSPCRIIACQLYGAHMQLLTCPQYMRRWRKCMMRLFSSRFYRQP